MTGIVANCDTLIANEKTVFCNNKKARPNAKTGVASCNVTG